MSDASPEERTDIRVIRPDGEVRGLDPAVAVLLWAFTAVMLGTVLVVAIQVVFA